MSSSTTSQPSYTTKSPTIKRILKEAAELSHAPTTDYTASPLDSNFFEWHFTLRGPPSPSPYAHGLYHGRIVLPPTYPLRPPSFRFLTPSGRFEPNREICLSISGHHEEMWQPAWGIRTALVAIRAFMESEAKGQVGGVDASVEVRRRYAKDSRAWRCVGCGGKSCEDIMQERESEVAAGGSAAADTRLGEHVPAELRLGYRDELGGKDADAGVADTGTREQHGEKCSENRSRTPSAPQISAAVPAAVTSQRPPGPAPRPTPTRPLQASRRATPQRDGGRLDMAIAAVAAALAFLIIRKLAWYL